MGNSLLDFVMSLVRDPDAAAGYAADPAGTLARAQLAGVTPADVDNLIPVVADSLAAATPGFGPAVPDAVSVWTSGAATAAFDAFDVPRTGAYQPDPPVIANPVAVAVGRPFEDADPVGPPLPEPEQEWSAPSDPLGPAGPEAWADQPELTGEPPGFDIL